MNIPKRKKNFIHMSLLFLFIAAFISGCGSELKSLPIPVGEDFREDEQDKEVKEPEVLLSAEDFDETDLLNGIPIIGSREEVDGKYQSYLTGEWKDVSVAKRRAFGVMVPNNKPALPQYGISKASVIFEAPLEGRVTRLLVVVEDYDDLDRIGPTRSARDYFIYEAMGKEAIFCNWGLTVVYCSQIINSDRVDNVSQPLQGIEVSAEEAFKRVSRPGYSTDQTGYMVIDGYMKAVTRLGYNPNYSANFTPQFVFAAPNTRAEYVDLPDATILRPGGTSNNSSGYGQSKPYFEYNESNRLYYRFQYGGKHIDEMNNEQLAYTNVIYQYTYGEVRDPNDYLAFQMHDEGKPVKIFTNGKVIEGTWKRFKDGEPARYFDNDGYEIVLNQGKTWICLIWEEYSEHAEYE